MRAWRARVAWLEDAAITVTMRAVPAPDEGLWVALKDDAYTVVGSGKTFAEARAEATEPGMNNPSLSVSLQAYCRLLGIPCR